MMTRDLAHQASRVVVKVGSSSISGEREHQVPGLVDALAAWRKAGSDVVLVSSGAIAVGAPFLKLTDRPQDLATQQAAAAVGQNLLMARYHALFEKYSIITGQVLLTVGDLENGTHRTNALRTIERLLGLGIIPIVNENDTVATQEIRFGDNDRLAALVSELVGADLLVLLSDVDALYSHPPTDPRATKIDTGPLGGFTRRGGVGGSDGEQCGNWRRRYQSKCRQVGQSSGNSDPLELYGIFRGNSRGGVRGYLV